MGARGLAESRHATSAGSSDVSLHVGHHCEDDENARCDDGGGLHGDAEFLCESDEELSGHWYVLLCPYDEHVPAPIHVVEYEPLLHGRVYLNGLCSGDGVKD